MLCRDTGSFTAEARRTQSKRRNIFIDFHLLTIIGFTSAFLRVLSTSAVNELIFMRKFK